MVLWLCSRNENKIFQLNYSIWIFVRFCIISAQRIVKVKFEDFKKKFQFGGRDGPFAGCY